MIKRMKNIYELIREMSDYICKEIKGCKNEKLDKALRDILVWLSELDIDKGIEISGKQVIRAIESEYKEYGLDGVS